MTVPIASPKPTHYLFTSCEAWGHSRPMCTLAARMVKARPVIITFLTIRPLYERIENEIARNFAEGDEARSRIRVIALMHDETKFLDFEMIDASWTEAYNNIIAEQPVTCAKTGKQLSPVTPPKELVFDMFAFTMARIARKISGNSVNIYCWVTIATSAAFWLFGPGGGFGDDNNRVIEEKAKKEGKSFIDAAAEHHQNLNNRVIEIPGMPPMWDYEHYPQASLFSPQLVGTLHTGATEFLHSADGTLVSSSECFEPPEAIAAYRQWMAEKNRKAYIMGPLVADHAVSADKESQQSAKAPEIHAFMERILKSHGPNSMLYVSFGSIFWSTEPDKIWAFVDVLLNKKIPFVMSHASPFAKVPDWIVEKANETGLGLFSPWSPQQTILNHPATGWFVTHCGFNGLTESLSAGCPLICWPYQADQPTNTVYLTDYIEVAYELTEVRSGHGLKPIYRNGKTPEATIDSIRAEVDRVLSLAFGPDGAKKRENVTKVKERIAKLWQEGGKSKLEFEQWLEDTATKA